MNVSPVPSPHSLVLVCVSVSGPGSHSLADAARLAGVHPDLLRHYCRIGLFGEERARTDREPVFDDDALYELRRFEHYRRRHGVGRQTLRLLFGLWREVDRLQAELRFLRGL